MAMDVGKAFLHNPEDRKLHFFRQTRKILWDVERVAILLRSENPST